MVACGWLLRLLDAPHFLPQLHRLKGQVWRLACDWSLQPSQSRPARPQADCFVGVCSPDRCCVQGFYSLGAEALAVGWQLPSIDHIIASLRSPTLSPKSHEQLENYDHKRFKTCEFYLLFWSRVSGGLRGGAGPSFPCAARGIAFPHLPWCPEERGAVRGTSKRLWPLACFEGMRSDCSGHPPSGVSRLRRAAMGGVCCSAF